MLFWQTRKIYSIWNKEKVSGKYPWLPSIMIIIDGGIWSSRSGKGHAGASAEFVKRKVCPSAEWPSNTSTFHLITVLSRHFLSPPRCQTSIFVPLNMSSHSCKNSWINSMATNAAAIRGQRYSGLPVPNPSPSIEVMRNVVWWKNSLYPRERAGVRPLQPAVLRWRQIWSTSSECLLLLFFISGECARPNFHCYVTITNWRAPESKLPF